MRYVKALGLAAIAAAAIMAFVGASSASAAIDICLGFTSNVSALTAAECTAHGGTIHTESKKVLFHAHATKPELKGSLSQVCDESLTHVTTKGDGTAGLTIDSLSFTGNCKPCTEVETFAPYSGTLIMEGENYFLKSTGSAKLKNCFGVSCKFANPAGKEITLKLTLGTNHMFNVFKAEAEELVLVEGNSFICGSKGTWTANYEVLEPLSFYFFLL
jgi:hypothetical protein